MGVAEGRFIAINANAWLRQRREQGDVWSKSCQLSLQPSHHHQHCQSYPHACRKPHRRHHSGQSVKGCGGCPPVGGRGQSRTLRVRILYTDRGSCLEIGPGEAEDPPARLHRRDRLGNRWTRSTQGIGIGPGDRVDPTILGDPRGHKSARKMLVTLGGDPRPV